MHQIKISGNTRWHKSFLFVRLVIFGVLLSCKPATDSQSEKSSQSSNQDYEKSVLVSHPNLEYPLAARDVGGSGDVSVIAKIDSLGSITGTTICKSSGSLIWDDAAEQMVRGMKFTAALQDSMPVASSYTCYFRFLDHETGGEIESGADYNTNRFEVILTDFESGDFATIEAPAEMIKPSSPVYPPIFMNAGIEGVVWIQSLVGDDGKVKEVKIAKTSGIEGLDKAAAEAAWTCEYKPGIQCSRPINMWVTYKVDFKLSIEFRKPSEWKLR